MHADCGDTLFTQLVGRKRWYLIDPEYTSKLAPWAQRLNLAYFTGYDVHNEPLPEEVVIQEVTLNPGDILYFPAFTWHAVDNLDRVTLGADSASFDLLGALYRHWFLAAGTIFNPFTPIKAIDLYRRKGAFTTSELYFDSYTSEANKHDKDL